MTPVGKIKGITEVGMMKVKWYKWDIIVHKLVWVVKDGWLMTKSSLARLKLNSGYMKTARVPSIVVMNMIVERKSRNDTRGKKIMN